MLRNPEGGEKNRARTASDDANPVDGPLLPQSCSADRGAGPHPHWLYPQTWQFTQPSSNESWPAPHSGQLPRKFV